MTRPSDFDFLETAAPTIPGNGGPPAPPLPESEIARLLRYVPHGQMHPALTTLAGHFAAKLGPRYDEIIGIIEPATSRWEQPVDLETVRQTVRDVVELERQKRAAREAAPPYDDRGFEETIIDTAPEAEAGEPTAMARPKKGGRTEEAQPFETLPLADFRTASFAGATRLVPSLGLIEQGVGVFAAPGGHGKSVAMLNLICGWAGATVPLAQAIPAARRLRILGLQVENPAGIEQERVNKILGIPSSPDGVYLFTRTEPIRFSGPRGRPNERALERLGATLDKRKPLDLVVFDPLIHLHEAEENSASEMMRWLVPLREVCRRAGVAIIVVHHAGWAADGEDARGRGSTAIRAWSDFELAMRKETRNEKTLFRMNLVKANFAPLWKQHLTLEFDESTYLFRPVDEAETLCSPDALVAWMVEDLKGIWTEKWLDFYTAVSKQFNCSTATARRAVDAAKRSGKLREQGRGKPIEVVSTTEKGLL